MSLTFEIQDLRKRLSNLALSIVSVSFESLFNKGDVGTGADQLAIGNHTHNFINSDENLDGGSASSIYLITQIIDGGSA